MKAQESKTFSCDRQIRMFITTRKVYRKVKNSAKEIQNLHANQNFFLVLFITLYKVVISFECTDDILKCDHSNESYWVALSCGVVYYAVQGGSNFSVCG